MPVEDHPVHERTIEKPGTKWGCWNHRRVDGYWAPQRKFRSDGSFYVSSVYIRNTMTTVCHYAPDHKCEGCTK